MTDEKSSEVFLDPIFPKAGPAKVAKLVRLNDNPEKPESFTSKLTAPSPKAGGSKSKKKTISYQSNQQRSEQDESKKTTVKCTKAVVIDVGTAYLKAGFAGNEAPACVIRSAVGGTRHGALVHKQGFIGKAALNGDDTLAVNPVSNGVITDWEAMEKLWREAYGALSISSEEHAVLLCDPPLSPITNREKYAEIMFEAFNAPAMNIENQSILSMYSYGKTTGLVLECGHGCSSVVPINNGYCLPSCISRTDYGGHVLDEYLIKLLRESGQTVLPQPFQILEDIKAKHCYIATNTDSEILHSANSTVEYKLPDGNSINLGKERFLCPEALFHPDAVDSREPGLHTMVMNSINRCDIELKNDMLRNILLSGGSTKFRGFPERLQNELNLISPRAETEILAAEQRQNAVWLGGSILASLESFQSLWIRKKDYQEKGPFHIYRKFV